MKIAGILFDIAAVGTAVFVDLKAHTRASVVSEDIQSRVNPVAGEPTTTVLTFDDDAIATTILKKINANTVDPDSRVSLASHYAAAFPTSSAFFEATAAVARGAPAKPAPWPILQVFRCEADTGPDSHQVYLAIWDRFAFGAPEQMGEFVQEAEHAMRMHGRSCDLMMLWSKAILREAEWHPDAVPAASQEKAVRILLDVGETYSPLQEGQPSPGLFLDLAGYFDIARHDYVSAYVATRWAEYRLGLGDERPELRERYRARIARYLAKYSARLPSAPLGRSGR